LTTSDSSVSTINKEIQLIKCTEGAEYYEVGVCEAETLLLEGIQLASESNDKAAKERFINAASHGSDYSLPLFWMGYCAYLKGDAGAYKWFDKAIKRNPRYLRAYWLKAKSLKNHDPSQAFSEMAELLKLFPNYAPAAFFMGEVLESHGVYDESIHWYDEALRVNPFLSSAALGLGRLFEIKNKTEEAGIFYKNAADMAPSWVEAQYAMAYWSYSRKDLEKAVDYCSRALRIDPDHAGAQSLSKKILA
jgi:tetratricopeptide (TPR) repeat protein